MAQTLVTTAHPKCIIAYARHFEPSKTIIEYLKDVYFCSCDKESQPMYAFLNGITLIYTYEKEDAVNDLTIAGKFARSVKPEQPTEYNLFRFNLNDEEMGFSVAFNVRSSRNLERIHRSLDIYYHDIYRIMVPFDIVHCNK